ncbi:MAG: hypothetical protein ABL921_25725 [Pirellula sp.]
MNSIKPSTRSNYLLCAATTVACIMGCAVAPPPMLQIPSAPMGSIPAGAQGIAPAAPMTLPHYLGIESVASGFRRVVYRSRVRVGSVLPVVAPRPAAAAPVAISDPSCLQSPAPAVAAAASIQQAEASAPAKVQALAFLATQNMCRNPQVEEAFLAAMDDPSDCVRVAAVQGVIDSRQKCGCCGADRCRNCCTPAVQTKVQQLAYATDNQGCPCEPNAKVRRLARLAACSCHPEVPESPQSPEEFPPAFVREMVATPLQ